MRKRIPTQQEYQAYRGAHCHKLWIEVGSDWVCPACARTKYQILRWTTRFPRTPAAFEDWMAGLHRHHDHSQGLLSLNRGRFPQTVICDQCNAADGVAKRQLDLPENFSFSPSEISLFIEVAPHGKHKVIIPKASEVYRSLSATPLKGGWFEHSHRR